MSVIYVKEDAPVPPIPAEPALKTPYPPDRFQRFAIEAIEKGENVLITAKTGSGKTFVGEYQIAKSLSRGGRVFYTTPIKSLSNQKFHDLSKLFPEASVGIMTGDIKFRPDAQVLVMTTEILRNLLYKKGTATESVGTTAVLSLDGLDAVVFDEVHYINDPDRGHVWEETLMLLPPSVKLVLLSATLSRPEMFAGWLAETKKTNIWVISTQWRAVPLYHHVIDQKGKLVCIYDPKECFDADAYRAWLQVRKEGLLAYDKFKEKVKVHVQEGAKGPVGGKVRPKAFEHQLNECLDDLYRSESLPAIVFQFSRKGCERLAAKTQGSFIDTSDQAAVKHIWHHHLSRFSDSLDKSPQYHALYELVQRGIAFHHSGVVPFLKEILEILFNKGYIKVLYATETFAVGINMPTKTVIFTQLDKFTDKSMRLLKSAEYIQMAGRAGRRGKDEKGIVIYLPQRDPLDVGDLRHMLTGAASSFQSRMGFGYDFLLKMLNSSHIGARSLIESSYWYQLEKEAVRLMEYECEKAQKELKALQDGLTEEQMEACQTRFQSEQKSKMGKNAVKKAADRELARWHEEHRESIWNPIWSRYNKMLEQTDVLHRKHNELQTAKELDVENLPVLRRRLAVVEAFGFLDADGGLGAKGRLASESNEGHPFLLPELFLRLAQQQQETDADGPANSAQQNPFSTTELLTLLAVFLGEEGDREPSENNKHPDDLNVPKAIKDELLRINKDAQRGMKEEKTAGLDPDYDFWTLSTEWVELVQEWVTNTDGTLLASLAQPEEGHGEARPTLASLAQSYGVFEGNIQKALMKLSGLLDEWEALCRLASKPDMLVQLEGARELILRDIVLAESLYLRL